MRWAPSTMGGGRVRIAPRFARVSDGAVLWAKPYEADLSDVFQLQAEIAERVALGLQVSLRVIDRVARDLPTTSAAAYDAYLRGRFQLERDEFDAAVGSFERAIALDSSFAPAWAGLAHSASMSPFLGASPAARKAAFDRAEHAARRALALDAGNAEAHTALGWTLLTAGWDWRGAGAAFDRAIEYAPQYAQAHQRSSLILKMQDRTDEAIQAVDRALELDPLASNINTNYGWHLLLAGRLDEAVPHLERARELDPEYLWPHCNLGTIYLWQARWDAARAEWRRALRIAGMDSVRVERVVAAVGPDVAEQEDAHRILERWAREPGSSRVIGAWFLSMMGADDRAVQLLVTAYEEGDPNPIDAVVLLRRHRADPRAARVLRELGLQ